MTVLIVLIFYRTKVPSLVRCGFQNILNSQTFWLLDPASVSRGQLKQKDILFSWETNHHAIICCTYKTGCYCAHQVPSLSPLPICLPFYCSLLLLAPWPTPLSLVLLLPALRRSTTTTLGTTPRRKVDDGEIPELADFFKRTIVTEADRKAYHDLGWLFGNLISFIPEVDVPTVEGSIVLCFECQLAAGLGLPPSKFLSNIMSYLGCSLVVLVSRVAMRVLVRNSSRYQLVLVLLFSGPILQDHF
jgi:hypothetical protein